MISKNHYKNTMNTISNSQKFTSIKIDNNRTYLITPVQIGSGIQGNVFKCIN